MDCSKKRIRYAVRAPFPDEDMYCFLLDKNGGVHYHESKADAEFAASFYVDAVVVEFTYCGI